VVLSRVTSTRSIVGQQVLVVSDRMGVVPEINDELESL
jgi:hypothetical protein